MVEQEMEKIRRWRMDTQLVRGVTLNQIVIETWEDDLVNCTKKGKKLGCLFALGLAT